MAGKSNYLESALLNWLKGTTFPAAPANTYLALFTTNPNDAGTGAVEPTGNGYARATIASSVWSAITGGTTTPEQLNNASVVAFPTPTPSGWGTIVGVGLYDALTSGNLLYWNSISPTVIGAAANVQLSASSLNITDD